MNTPSYKTQFDKITRSYLANELNPYVDCACFIGNLLGAKDWYRVRQGDVMIGEGFLCEITENTDWWTVESILKGQKVIQICAGGLYTEQEIVSLENNFLKILYQFAKRNGLVRPSMLPPGEELKIVFNVQTLPGYEDALFHAMESTLEMLKAIHISKGEVVDPIPFAKRELVTA